MENKSKPNLHNQKSSSSTPPYLKEISRIIQNHTNLITKKLSIKNSQNFCNEAEKVFGYRKRCLEVLSFIDQEKLKSATNEQENLTQKSLKTLEEFGTALFQEPEKLLSNTLFSNEESLIDLFSASNKTIEQKHNLLKQKVKFYENFDLKSIKKLLGIYKEKANNKSYTNFLVQLGPLQRELSYIMENSEERKLKLSEKEKTNKLNNSKAEAYCKELECTKEKYRNALEVQEACERQYSQLASQKTALDTELKYIQENLTEKVSAKGKIIKVFRFKESNEKAKMLNYNNQICLQDIEKAHMLNFDLRKIVKNLKIEKTKSEEEQKKAKKFIFYVISLKVLQIQLDKSKAQVERLENQSEILEQTQQHLEIIFEVMKKNEEFSEENAKDEKKLRDIEKRFAKYQKLHDKLAAEAA